MCYGNSIINTCPQCSAVSQTFEFHDCHFGETPTETWWILPSAILEDVYITDPCDEFVFLNNWLDELPSPELLSIPDNAPETHAEDEDIKEVDHLKLICEWYDNVDCYISSIKASLPSMRSRCSATKNAALITQMSILEASVGAALAKALKKLECVIEVSAWIRQCTASEQDVRDTDPEELRAAMWEMKMNAIDLEREDAVETVTKDLGDLATKVWYEMEAVEKENERYLQLYGTAKVVEAKKTTLVGRVWSMIVT